MLTTADAAETGTDDVALMQGTIDAIDSSLIDLVEQRRALSLAIQQARAGQGEPSLSVSRELETAERYRAAIGQSGSDLARFILAFSRRPAQDDSLPGHRS